MTPISLMPPIDYCPSCEGRKAERQALQIGAARAEQAELQAAADPASPAIDVQATGTAGVEPVDGVVRTLLAPDLAVQAMLAGSAVGETGTDEAALRLRGAEAYGGR